MISATALGRIASAAIGSEDIKLFTGGAPVTQGGIEIDIDTFIDDGHSVPISLRADGAQAIGLFALLNPTPEIAIFRFNRLTATRAISTKIRLADTQDVIAVAHMEDGSFRRASKNVTVLLGGCNV